MSGYSLFAFVFISISAGLAHASGSRECEDAIRTDTARLQEFAETTDDPALYEALESETKRLAVELASHGIVLATNVPITSPPAVGQDAFVEVKVSDDIEKEAAHLIDAQEALDWVDESVPADDRVRAFYYAIGEYRYRRQPINRLRGLVVAWKRPDLFGARLGTDPAKQSLRPESTHMYYSDLTPLLYAIQESLFEVTEILRRLT